MIGSVVIAPRVTASSNVIALSTNTNSCCIQTKALKLIQHDLYNVYKRNKENLLEHYSIFRRET